MPKIEKYEPRYQVMVQPLNPSTQKTGFVDHRGNYHTTNPSEAPVFNEVDVDAVLIPLLKKGISEIRIFRLVEPPRKETPQSRS